VGKKSSLEVCKLLNIGLFLKLISEIYADGLNVKEIGDFTEINVS